MADCEMCKFSCQLDKLIVLIGLQLFFNWNDDRPDGGYYLFGAKWNNIYQFIT